MQNTTRVVGLLAMALGALPLIALPLTAVAQTAVEIPKATVKAGYKAPRLSDGKPDISGAWGNATATRMERTASYGDTLIMSRAEAAKLEGDTADRNARINAPTDKAIQENWTTTLGKGPDTLDECRGGSRGTSCGYNAGWTDPGDHIMRVNGEPRTSLITFPRNGRMPARVAGSAAPRARIVESSEDGPASTSRGQNDNPEGRSLGERCIMSFGISSGPVMTSQLYNNTYKFVQTKDHVAIWVEMVHDVRVIPLNTSHRTDGVRPWMGDGIGWWDGDTLVVETVNFHPLQNVRGAGPKVKVTERFTRVGPDRLHYAFKVEDPDTWVSPWAGEYEFSQATDVYEYACHEGNYGLQNILGGARFEEAGAAASGARAER